MKKIRSYIRFLYYYYCKYYLRFVIKLSIKEEKNYFKPNYSDLYFLYKLIIKFKPVNLIEAGGGYSTFIILKALEKNYKFYGISPVFRSYEQSSKYIKIHHLYLKKNLSKKVYSFVKIIKTNLKLKSYYGRKISILNNLKFKDIDFYYEDRTDHKKYKIAGDALLNEKKNGKRFIILIDGMIPTVNFYKKNLDYEYFIKGGFFTGTAFIPKS